MVIITEEKLTRKNDFSSIKEELGDAMKYDHSRKQIDDAKKRAVYQTGTYDQFKQLVAGCHLKPLAKGEFSEGQMAPPTKHFVNKTCDLPDSSKNMKKLEPVANLNEMKKSDGIKNIAEFSKMFRRAQGAKGQWELLLSISVDRFETLFRPEVDGEMMSELLLALHAGAENDADPMDVLSRLHTIVHLDASEFALNFIVDEDRRTVKEILKVVGEADETMADEVRGIFKC